MKRSTRFKPGISGNEAAKWKPRQSGNPAGKSKLHLQFDQSFNEALLAHGSPEEAADLLWEAARERQAWAIQEVCRRFAPEAPSRRLVHEVDRNEIDYSNYTDEQLQQLETILGRPQAKPAGTGGGEDQT